MSWLWNLLRKLLGLRDEPQKDRKGDPDRADDTIDGL